MVPSPLSQERTANRLALRNVGRKEPHENEPLEGIGCIDVSSYVRPRGDDDGLFRAEIA